MPRYGPSYELRTLTDNPFWRERIGQVVKEIIVQTLGEGEESCVALRFDNAVTVYVEYVNEEEFPDMLRIGSEPILNYHMLFCLPE